MDSMELASRFQKLSEDSDRIRLEVEKLTPHLKLKCDQWAAGRASGELCWIAENCHVISAHLSGAKLDDGMGYFYSREELPPGYQANPDRVIEVGESIEQRNRSQM